MRIFIIVMTLMTFLISGCGGGKGTDGKFRIVTSFYPIYITTINVTKTNRSLTLKCNTAV